MATAWEKKWGASQATTMTAHAQKDQVFGEVFEEFNPVSEKDGQVYGYAFGVREIKEGGTGVWAWCQYSRQTRGGFEAFGKIQRSQHFDSFEQASAWFKATAQSRIRANRIKWARDGHRVIGLK